LFSVVNSPRVNLPLSFIERSDKFRALGFAQSIQAASSSEQSRFQSVPLSSGQLFDRLFDLLDAHATSLMRSREFSN
jgi:hypothetical protein